MESRSVDLLLLILLINKQGLGAISPKRGVDAAMAPVNV
jgi:hypothetical protein